MSLAPNHADVILYPVTPKSELSSRLVAAGELLDGLGSGERQYSHAAVLESGLYEYEAKFPKTGLFQIDRSRTYEVWNLGPTDEQRAQILRWCREHVGDWYNLLGVVTAGLFKLRGTYYCSEFACMAYASAGLHPGDLIMSPNSIPQYPGARMIYRRVPSGHINL